MQGRAVFDATLVTLDMVRLDGMPAIKLDVDLKPPSDDKRWIIHYAVAGGRSYCIWIGAPKTDYDKYAEDLDALVKSFKLLKTE